MAVSCMANLSLDKSMAQQRIAIVSEHSTRGGAAMASYRHYKALLASGVEVEYVTFDSFKGWKKVYNYVVLYINKSIEAIIKKAVASTNFRDFSYAFIKNRVLLSHLKNFDVVDLHWIRHFTNPEIVNSLKGHVFVTTHDMRYLTDCHYLPIYNEKDLLYIDTFQKLDGNNNRFRYSFNDNIVFRPPSSWLHRAVAYYREGHKSILSRYAVFDLIPFNNKRRSSKGNNVLCGAVDIIEFRKGGWMIDEVIQDCKEMVFHTFGQSGLVGTNVKNHGYLTGNDLKDLYLQSDVLLFSSIQENYSNILLEATFYGLPIVCFDVGGNADIVNHRFNGFVASNIDVSGLIEGLNYCLNDSNWEGLSRNALKIAAVHQNLIEYQFDECVR